VDDTWWQNLLNCIGHEFVAPDFLRKPALQEWHTDEEVQRDTKALARNRIIGADTDEPEALIRLRRAYANGTGEHERLASGPIDVVLSILAAGYLASIDPSLQPIAGIIQGSARENREGFDHTEEQLSAIYRRVEELGPNPYVVRILSERAEHELNLLLKQRSLSPDRVRRELITLGISFAIFYPCGVFNLEKCHSNLNSSKMSYSTPQIFLLEEIAVDTFLCSSFGTVVMTLFQGLFTAPSWQTFTYLACGWALASDRHTKVLP